MSNSQNVLKVYKKISDKKDKKKLAKILKNPTVVKYLVTTSKITYPISKRMYKVVYGKQSLLVLKITRSTYTRFVGNRKCYSSKQLMYFKLWIKIDQLDITCFIISLFTAQHVSNVSTSIFRSLRLIVDLFHVLYCCGSMCVGITVWFGWGGVVSLCRPKNSFSLHKDTTVITSS